MSDNESTSPSSITGFDIGPKIATWVHHAAFLPDPAKEIFLRRYVTLVAEYARFHLRKNYSIPTRDYAEQVKDSSKNMDALVWSRMPAHLDPLADDSFPSLEDIWEEIGDTLLPWDELSDDQLYALHDHVTLCGKRVEDIMVLAIESVLNLDDSFLAIIKQWFDNQPSYVDLPSDIGMQLQTQHTSVFAMHWPALADALQSSNDKTSLQSMLHDFGKWIVCVIWLFEDREYNPTADDLDKVLKLAIHAQSLAVSCPLPVFGKFRTKAQQKVMSRINIRGVFDVLIHAVRQYLETDHNPAYLGWYMFQGLVSSATNALKVYRHHKELGKVIKGLGWEDLANSLSQPIPSFIPESLDMIKAKWPSPYFPGPDLAQEQ
ncbi:hypothetical protein BDV96DRAFT_642251 [Lophiotrema nucula]|uniref:Uncharacterized protein n=1 Tax=Lophiotrema nucula TaxID=690887 RepID=A0A6A5ZK47_9PLEO|nr:hypothetical protein BDV96DRAFT_642251 [Lophiotrema nucula]